MGFLHLRILGADLLRRFVFLVDVFQIVEGGEFVKDIRAHKIRTRQGGAFGQERVGGLQYLPAEKQPAGLAADFAAADAPRLDKIKVRRFEPRLGDADESQLIAIIVLISTTTISSK